MPRRGSILRDLFGQSGIGRHPVLLDGSGVGSVSSPDLPPTGIIGAHYAETRNVLPFAFDDSIDTSNALECFFQMPVGVLKIYSAQVWIQQKPFRRYVSSNVAEGSHTHGLSASGANTSTWNFPNTNAEASHTHTVNALGNQGTLHTHTDSGDSTITSTESANHSHSNSGTGAGSSHTHGIIDHWHDYLTPGSVTASGSSHTHTLSPGIIESDGTGNLDLYLSDDGTGGGYGSALVSAVTPPIIAQPLTPKLTIASGDKRLKIAQVSGVRCRVQVLIMIDVLLKVTLT